MDLYRKTIYVSRLTSVGNKKLRIFLSVILSNAAVALDILIIVTFSTLLTDEITYSNEIIVDLITFLSNSLLTLPLLVIFRFLFLLIEKLNIESLSLGVAENLRFYVMKETFTKGNLSTSDAYYFITQVSVHISSFYRSFATFLNSSLQIVGYSLFLIYTDISIFSVFFIGAVILIIPTRYLIKRGKYYQHISFIEAKNVNSYIQRIIDNVFLIKILKTMKKEFDNFGILLKNYTSSQTSNVTFGALNSILPTFATLFILSFLFTTTSFVKTISIEFIGVLLRLFQSLSSFNNGLNLVINSSVHVEELYKLNKQSPSVELNNYVINENLEQAVKVDKVSFKYFNSDKNLFTDLSINFEKGTHTILTGPNGSGKSTILGLISGLYIPQSGKVSISSNKVGYIGVTPLIIDGTIKDNLLYGNDLEVKDEEILEILEKFSFTPENKSMSLDTVINNTSLSSGQMQKVSFMRSLLNNSDILLLDEATSNLDENSKVLIFDILRDKKITIINSTHTKEDFVYDLEFRISVNGNERSINIY